MRYVKGFGLLLTFVSIMMVSGCSSSPNQDEMRQLDDLKAEVASLQRDISNKEQRRGTLDREVAEKNAKVRTCNDDQQTVHQRLGK